MIMRKEVGLNMLLIDSNDIKNLTGLLRCLYFINVFDKISKITKDF